MKLFTILLLITALFITGCKSIDTVDVVPTPQPTPLPIPTEVDTGVQMTVTILEIKTVEGETVFDVYYMDTDEEGVVITTKLLGDVPPTLNTGDSINIKIIDDESDIWTAEVIS